MKPINYCTHNHCSPDLQAPALYVADLMTSYPGDGKAALKGINLSVEVGKSVALVGSNGAGKSTLFKVVSGFLPVGSGTVRVFGHDVGSCHHRIVYLPQRSEIDWLFPITVLDLVLCGRYVHSGWFKKPSAQDLAIARDALHELHVADLANRQISQLSGGQQQRVLIARALAQQADLLLLDEPLNAVDAQTRQTVAAVLEKIKSEGKTVLVATHYYDQEDARYDGAVFLKDGEQVQGPAGKPQNHDCC